MSATTFDNPNLLDITSPLAHPAHFGLLDLVVFSAFALTLHHAITQLRKGDRYPLFQWTVALLYGVTMELIAFNYLNNYEHGTFTVQLYHGKLPLYVVCLYPVFHYTGIKLVERWSLPLWREALLTGFAICLLDIPFDIVGPDAKWWSWANTDPNLAVRWLGVPVNSYYWYLMFGAGYCLLCRSLRDRVRRWPLPASLALAPLIAPLVVTVGTLLFQPLHLLQYLLGSVDTVVIALHLVGCGVLLLSTAVPDALPGVPQLMAIPFVLHVWHLGLIVALGAAGQVPDFGLKISMALGAATFSIATAIGWPDLVARRFNRPAMQRAA